MFRSVCCALLLLAACGPVPLPEGPPDPVPCAPVDAGPVHPCQGLQGEPLKCCLVGLPYQNASPTAGCQ